MKENFAMFASKVLSKEKNSKTSEANIILRFRRSFTAYRTEEVSQIFTCMQNDVVRRLSCSHRYSLAFDFVFLYFYRYFILLPFVILPRLKSTYLIVVVGPCVSEKFKYTRNNSMTTKS